MLKFIVVGCLSLSLFLNSCKKEVVKIKQERIEIRIKNTSLVDYKFVTINSANYDNSTSDIKKTDSVKAGKYSNYLNFFQLKDPVDFDVQVNDFFNIGVSHYAPQQVFLENGKYILEVYIPNRGEIKLSYKLVKEN
jgi:hypothetical protein